MQAIQRLLNRSGNNGFKTVKAKHARSSKCCCYGDWLPGGLGK